MAKSVTFITIAAAILLFLCCAIFGGSANRLDAQLVASLAVLRSHQPLLTSAAIVVTGLGSAPATLGLMLAAAALLVLSGRRRAAIQLVAIILSGRLAVEMLKLGFARPRPSFDAHPVIVHSASFPSGHAANSMISFVAIALFLAAAERRAAALAIAIGASLVVGATRPLLGVHWPSDVLAGWLLGLGWALLWYSRCAASTGRFSLS